MPTTKRESVEAVVTSRLRQSPYLEVRRISCCFHEGVLTLSGRVSSYYLKQVAQSLVYRLEGVEQLSNRLEVVCPTDDAWATREPDVSTESGDASATGSRQTDNAENKKSRNRSRCEPET